MPAATDYHFPHGGIECRPGDYLIRRGTNTLWTVYRVEDVLLVKRLVVRSTTPVSLALEEELLDSMTPAYFREVHLLLTLYADDFQDEAAARAAIIGQTLIGRERGLLRPAQEFRAADCRVIRPSR